MNRRPTAISCTVLFAFACLSGTSFAADKTIDELAKEGHWMPNKWEMHSQLLNKEAPKLDLSEWIGKEVTAKDLKGNIVVVDFWATWCGPCKAAIPHNNEIAKKYADNGVLVVGACGGGQEENMQNVVTTHKMEYPTARVSKESTQAWGVQWWPHYVVVDKKGTVRAIGIQPDTVEKVIDALLEEK